MLYFSHLLSETTEKLEKLVLLGFRKTKETRRGCALGLQRNQRNSKSLCSWASEKHRYLLYLSHLASEKPKKLEKAVLLGFRETKETRKGCALGRQRNQRNSKRPWVLLGFRQTKETRNRSALGLLAWVPWLLKTRKDQTSKTKILYKGADQKCFSKCRLCPSALGDAAL